MSDLVRLDTFDIFGLAYSGLKRALSDINEARGALVKSADPVAESEEAALKATQKDVRVHMQTLIEAAEAGVDTVLLRPLDVPGRRIIKRFRDPIYPNGPESEGLVFEASLGDPVVSPVNGIVQQAGILAHGATWGKRVAISAMGNVLIVWLCHLDSIDVKAGDVVNVGDVIGRAGKTGNAQREQLLLVCQITDGTGIQLPGLPFKVADPWPMLFEKLPSDVYYLEETTVEQ